MTFEEIASHVYAGFPCTASQAGDLAADMILEGYCDLWEAWDDVLDLRRVNGVRFTRMGYEFDARTLAQAIDYRNEQIDHSWQVQYFDQWHDKFNRRIK